MQPIRGDLGVQTRMSIISRHTACLLFAALCCLIFIFWLQNKYWNCWQVRRTSNGEGGGVWAPCHHMGLEIPQNLLSNLHNMLGILKLLFFRENNNPITSWLLCWRAAWERHLRRPCSTQVKSYVSILVFWDAPFALFHPFFF